MSALGKGLEQLFSDLGGSAEDLTGTSEVAIDLIDNDPGQPRQTFDGTKLEELASSIRTHGIMQPLLVVQTADRYRIVAGERRFRAAKMAGLTTIPVLVRELSEQDILEISLIENVQREDLNPIEQAEGIRKLMTNHGMTQEEVAERIGKSRSAVANVVRLLSLPEQVQKMVRDGELTSGHARALLPLAMPSSIEETAGRVQAEGLTVRQTEELVKITLEKSGKAAEPENLKPKPKEIDPEVRDAQERMSRALDARVRITGTQKKGKILIEYASRDELDRLFDLLTEAGV